MPVMNGYVATQKIRKDLEQPACKTPIIALTASVLKQDIDKCKEAGMDAYIAKPFKPDDLFIEIAKMLKLEIRKIKLKEATSPNEGNKEHKKKQTDLTYLTDFCEGEEEKMNKYIQLFVKSSPPLIKTIEHAIEENDLETIANQIHGFKTRWLMMGMEETNAMGMQLEQLCREQGDLSQIKSLLNKLIENITLALEELTSNETKLN